MKTICIRAALAAAALSATVAFAHHSGAMFDKEKDVTFIGTVKEFQYTNPHSWLIVDVPDASGKVVTWGFEAEGPSTLLRAGIRRSDFPPGAKVTIVGNPMKDGRPAAYWKTATKEDGTVVRPAAGFAVN
jgi:hypothetical protein